MYVRTSDKPIRPGTKFEDFVSSTNADYKEVILLNRTEVIQAPQIPKWSLKQCIVHLEKTYEQIGYSRRGPRPCCRKYCGEKDEQDEEVPDSCASDMPSSRQRRALRSCKLGPPPKDFLFRPGNPGKSDTEQDTFIGILHS